MSTIWSSGSFAKSMAGFWGLCGGICWMLGLVFAILGIISEKIETTLGLSTLSWYLLAIALFAAGISWYIGWAVGILHKE